LVIWWFGDLVIWRFRLKSRNQQLKPATL